MRKITDEEIRFFDENGYVICRGVLHADELEQFRSESARLIDEIQRGGPADKMCTRGPEGVPYYLTYLHANPNSFSLRLLAHPFIGDLLTRMVGPDFIPCYEALVFKLPGHGSSVPWHRDGGVSQDTERIFNIDIYPDRSTVANSCVWVVPGSHLWEHGKAMEWAERGRRDFQLPGAVPAEMEPGDVLLHHTKVLHGSTVNTSNELRRVVYFDNRAASWNERHHWFTREVIEKRCRLFQYALHERKQNPYPSDDETFHYEVPAGLPVWNAGDPIDLHARREAPSKGGRSGRESFQGDPFALRPLYHHLRVVDVCDAMDGIGYFDIGLMDPKVRPLWPGMKFWGVAFTMRCVPANRPMWKLDTSEDIVNAHGIWFKEVGHIGLGGKIQPGHVIVTDTGGAGEVGFWGSAVSLSVVADGAVGIITDGYCRDTAEIALQKTPICARARGRTIIPGRIEVAEVQTRIGCGGVQVRPGDLVGCDDDGVVVVPLEVAREVAVHARAILLADMRARRKLYERLGMPLDATVDAETVEAYYRQLEAAK